MRGLFCGGGGGREREGDGAGGEGRGLLSVVVANRGDRCNVIGYEGVWFADWLFRFFVICMYFFFLFYK